MIEVSLSLIGQEVKQNIAETSVALGHETQNRDGITCDLHTN